MISFLLQRRFIPDVVLGTGDTYEGSSLFVIVQFCEFSFLFFVTLTGNLIKDFIKKANLTPNASSLQKSSESKNPRFDAAQFPL